MIVSASYRTDIPAFYGDWFMNRLAAGHCRVANPYGGKDYIVSLRPEDVDGFVFWTKNLAPFLASLSDLAGRALPFVVHYTINGYPRALEASVTDPSQAVEHMRRLADDFGPRVAVWRYDPILLTSLTPADWHIEAFAALAGRLAGATDEAVVSFAHIYAKTKRNLVKAARGGRFDWRDPEAAEKRDLIARLAAIARDHAMQLTICSQPALQSEGTSAARCIDATRLSDVADRPIGARVKGNRPGCLCHESRDIGAYDTCPHGCVYCYAVRHRALAQRNFRAHDATTDILARTPAKAATR